MAGTLTHPYNDIGNLWLRGSFHGHCSENSRCASLPLRDSVQWYQEAGADFLGLTDHDAITALDEMRRMYPDIILLEGFEYSSCENLLFVGEKAEPLYELPLGEALERRGDDLLSMVCHPTPRVEGPEYWSLEKMTELGCWPDGIEIYNGHYGTETGRANGRQPLGTGLWDEALTAGHRLWGYANDDSHDPEDLGNAWNMVAVEERTEAAVIRAARAGRCYGTTGLLLQGIDVDGAHLDIRLSAPARGRFIGSGGAVLKEAVDDSFEYTMAMEGYVRFEAEGDSGRIFLQPLFSQ